jgi:hypothetical protein
MTRLLIILILFTGCSARTDFNTVNIHLDPESKGWHFIELQKQGAKEDYKVADVKFDRGEFLDSAVVSDFDAVDYNVLDAKGNDISEQMKLPSVISHSNQKKYFTFYNPTKKDLEEVKKWLPDNREYEQIMRLQKEAQDKLIK